MEAAGNLFLSVACQRVSDLSTLAAISSRVGAAEADVNSVLVCKLDGFEVSLDLLFFFTGRFHQEDFLATFEGGLGGGRLGDSGTYEAESLRDWISGVTALMVVIGSDASAAPLSYAGTVRTVSTSPAFEL